MEVIKLKTPKGKDVEIPLSEKEADIEKPRLTIIKNGKKLYAPLVKEKPKNNEEAFIIVRTTDGTNYYVRESKKEETSKITKYIGRDKGREMPNDGISVTGVFTVPKDVHILKLYIGDTFLTHFKVNSEQKLMFMILGKGMDDISYDLTEFFVNFRIHSQLTKELCNKVSFYQGEALKIECNGETEKYVGDDIFDIRDLGSIKESDYKNSVNKYGFDKVDNNGSGGSIGSDDTIGGDTGDGNDG